VSRLSRRALAKYAADQISAGKTASEVAQHLAGVMVESGRSSEVDFLIGDIGWELERRGELVSAKVVSASELSREVETALKSQIKKTLKAEQVLLKKVIDKTTIGGIRVETAGKVWDETVSKKLTDLREAF
jgi:ATP synthase F1 delta subunit